MQSYEYTQEERLLLKHEKKANVTVILPYTVRNRLPVDKWVHIIHKMRACVENACIYIRNVFPEKARKIVFLCEPSTGNWNVPRVACV